MFNLAEVLTLIIGLLLALVFIDGVRRSLRSRTSSLKVDLVDSTELSNKDFEQEWLDGYDSEVSKEEVVEETHREIEELDIDKDKNSSGSLHQLLIINQSTDGNNTFSYKSISHLLVSYSFMFDERGYFVIADEDNNPLFSILNGRNPGTFLEGISTSDIAFVFDPLSVLNPVEGFDVMCEISQIISESFDSDLLDENRNILTKQMLVHMRQEAQEFQRQKLAIVS